MTAKVIFVGRGGSFTEAWLPVTRIAFSRPPSYWLSEGGLVLRKGVFDANFIGKVNCFAENS